MKPGAKYLLAVALTVLLAVGAVAAYKYLTSVTTVPPSPPDNTRRLRREEEQARPETGMRLRISP